jgi:hypothetical protein
MKNINLAFSPFDHDVNVPIFKIKYINDCYFDKLRLVVTNNDSKKQIEPF